MVEVGGGHTVAVGGQVAPNGVALKGGEVVCVGGGVTVIPPTPFPWAQEATSWRWVGQITSGNRAIQIREDGVNRLTTREGSSVTLRARPIDAEDDVVYLSDVETALVSVFDTNRTSSSSPIYVEELVVSDVMFTALQLDKGWKGDRHGYSFKYVLPAGILIEGGRRYSVEVVLRTYTQGPCSIEWGVDTTSLRTSRAHLGV